MMKILEHLADDNWREVNIMAIGLLGRDYPHKAGLVVDRILRDHGTADAVVLMGDAVADGGQACVRPETRQRLRDALLQVMRDDETVGAKTRAKAGTALGRIGDHRFGEHVWHLPVLQPDPGPDGRLPPEPLLGFIEIPAGRFWMGSDRVKKRGRRN